MLFTRRQFFSTVTSWVVATAGGIVFAKSDRLTQANPNKWVDPPTDESSSIAALINQVSQKLEAGTSISEILCDKSLMDLHPYPRFRQLIKKHATTKPVTMSSMDEPGERAVLKVEVVSADGKPQSNALVYVYHTSSAGWYAAKGIHVRANSGDQRHARLFAYGRTNQNGFIEFQTIRPAGYPDGELPAHYHVEVLEPSVFVTEIQFSDDPRLTSRFLEQSRLQGFIVSQPRKGSEGWWRIAAKITLRQ